MKQVGLNNLAIFSILLLFLFSSTAFAVDKDFDNISIDPITQLSTSLISNNLITDSFYVCPGDSIYDTLFLAGSDLTIPPAFFEIWTGPGNLTTEIDPSQDTIFAYYSYYPEQEEEISVVYRSVNNNGDTTYYRHAYVIFFSGDNPPSIEDQEFSSVACELTALRDLQIVASSPTENLIFSLVSGPGSVDSNTGILSYQPDTSGIFEFLVAVESGCGADTAVIHDSVYLNTPPQVFCYDSLVTLCDVEEICFDVFGFDVDSDPVELIMLEGIGNFNMTSDSTGQACFTPADVDSAVYRFIFRGADSCTISSQNFASESGGECCRDTSLITVVINRPPVLECPEPQFVFICDTTEFCVDLSAYDYENSDLTYNILSGNAVITDSTVCVTATESGTFEIVVEAVDDCGYADTCTVPITVKMNEAPYVNSAQDFAMNLCAPEEICFNATVDDVDINIASIVTNIGFYNEASNLVCFTPDTSGVYTVVITATDSCGLVDSSITNVTVDLNNVPVIDLGDNILAEACEGQDVCIEPIVTDDNLNRVVTSFGYYNAQTGLICFTPDTSGQYQIIAEAVDDCEVSSVDTVYLDVRVFEKPTLELGDSLFASMCTPEEICVNVTTNANYADIQYNFGQLNEQTGQICFTPDTAGTFILTAEITDSCGFLVSDSKIITVEFKSEPVIADLADTTVYLCQPTSICLPVSITDLDNDIASIVTNRGSYADGSICFVPYDSGSYEIIVTVTDSCGNIAVDTAMVSVQTDQAVSIVVPNDTSFFTCQLDTFCFPVSGIPTGAEVSVTGINTWYDAENSNICYFAECSNTNKITLTVATECNTYVNTFNVTVNCNTDPLVILPQDTTIFMCQLAPISLPVGVIDVDGNLADINVVGGIYDNVLNVLTFTPDTAGVYSFSVTATDSCDATDYDELFINVELNEAPVCVVPNDSLINLCEPTQISLPVYATDANGATSCEIIVGEGQIIDGNWVYNAVGDDSVTVTIQCVDACGATCEDTFTILIKMNNAPEWSGESEFSFEQCEPTEVFIPFEAFDIDGDELTFRLLADIGPFNDSGWTYTPNGSETVQFTAQVSDSCGAYADKLFTVTFKVNEAPFVDAGDDFSVFLCEPGEVCFDVIITDENRAYTSIPKGYFNFTTEQYCFNADTSGIYTIEVSATDSCGARTRDTVIVTVGINEAPVCSIDEIPTYYNFCDSVTATVAINSMDVNNNMVGCDIITGPGSLVDGIWTYTSYQSEIINVTIKCSDSCGAYCETSFTIEFDKNELPVIADQQFAENYCEDGNLRNIYIEAFDADEYKVYSLLGQFGQIDPVTGFLSYTPDTSGTYLFTVIVSDYCGADTALITDVIGINNKPAFNPFDSTIYLCAVEEICFDVSASDPDGDPITLGQYSGLGNFTQLTDSTGQTCFTPNNVDSATYTFVYCVTDSCGDYPDKFAYPQCDDTVNITVIINRAPEIVCPTDLKFFTCETDTFCFDIDANDPEFGELTFNILSGNATIDNKTVCVVGSETDAFDVIVEVVDDCGHADTCTVPVTIESNRAPYVTSAEDFYVSLCDVEPICFAVTADDLDFNLDNISVNFGTYDEINDQVCFDVDTSGVYTIITTATDSCGAFGSDTTFVTVDVNEAPIVNAGDDFAVALCEPGDVCFDVLISDNNLHYTSIPNGYLNFTSGQYCFTADTSGVYEIEVSATDSCALRTYDTVVVTVTISEGPFVDLGEDLDLFVCELGEYCIDISTINNFDSIVVNGDAVYNPQTSQLCVNLTEDGTYFASVQVFDTCGLSAYDEIYVNISSNNPPVISQVPDTTVYLCQPTSICLPFDVQDGNIASVTVNRGTYENGQICFVPYDSGSYEIIATVIDSCGLMVADTALVHVLTDQGIEITGQADTTIFVCELDTMCFPVYGIPDGAEVTVSGINTWYNTENSTVCYFAECSSANKIKVTASTACGSYEYEFTVTVICNTAPLVILPQDTTMTICGPEKICLPLGVTDIDNNLSDISVIGGTYDSILSQFCFDADTAGTYIIGVTANDTCGATDYDEIAITVQFNSAPEITSHTVDSTYMSCGGSEVCFPVDITDIDNNIGSVTTSIGNYSTETGLLCFIPDTAGLYCIEITAQDECGLSTIDTTCLTVEIGGFVQFECPTTIVADSICGADTVCVPLTIDGEILSVVSSIGTFENGQLCFFADTAGMYTVSVTATADCNEISCEFTVEVNNKIDVEITCPGDLDTLLCSADTLFFDYMASSSVESVIASYPAFIRNNQIVMPVDTAGSYKIDLSASGPCGIDTCSFNVNVILNTAPVITTIDTTLTVCSIDSICVPFDAFDIDTNLVEVTSSIGVVNGNTVCFLPIAYGQSSIVLTATDACGATGTVVANIDLIQGGSGQITCPEDQFATLCGPDSVCISIPILPLDADLTILDNDSPANANFDFTTGNLCLFVEEAGIHNITIIADALCASDTCSFQVTASMSQLPTISSPASIDSTLCLAEPTTLCFDAQTSGTGIDVSVTPSGTFSAGVVCVDIDTAGVYEVEIIASNDCGADTSYTTLNITGNTKPILVLPETQYFTWCPTDTNTICIDGIKAMDAVQITSFNLISGTGEFYKVFSDTGMVCFVPDGVGLYEFIFEASDGCHIVTDTFYADVQEREDCDVCVRVAIDGGAEVPVGVKHDVLLNIDANTAIGGFDILVSFDISVMVFNSATIVGTEIDGWEYFTYRLGSDDCGASCPSGLVRLVGLADLTNGPVHPPVETLQPNGTLVSMNFLIANDQNLGDLFLPIDFAWYDCGDNTFSNNLGTILYMDSRIYNSEQSLLWDEDDDVMFPESSRPFGLGASDYCMEGASSAPVRCIEFINGGIKVIHPDSIDDRGDINLNNVAYEIGDAVLYSNYFIYGIGVFTINLAGQIAASDVNADGLTLSVADLVLMIRVIVGDADPIPKLVPYDEELIIKNQKAVSEMTVTTNAVSDIGGMLLVYDLDDDVSINGVKPSEATSNMQMSYDIVENQLRVLIYDMGRNYIPSGENSIAEIAYEGSGDIALTKAEIVDYQGRPYRVLSKLNQLPQGFSLSQNYPNPFNPTTTIDLALPKATEWSLSIYNINGHLVRQFSGNDQAGTVSIEWDGRSISGGQVASGMYLYRVEASEFSETKKMILLK